MVRNVKRHRTTYVKVQPDVMSDALTHGELIAVGKRNVHVRTSADVTIFSPSAVLEIL